MWIINGRFLTQGITGVQRFAHEIIRELDNVVKPREYKILVPKNIVYKELKYKNIEIEICGNLEGHLWEQLELPLYVKKNKGQLLNLCNTAPIINPGVIAIHDIQTKVHPEFFSKKFALWYNILNYFNIKNSKKIITVSEFSKNEIIKYYGVSKDKIQVIYNGWQHMDRIKQSEDILNKFNIKTGEYILGVSSLNPNKNFKYILELAKLHPEYKFVIVGKKNSTIFKEIIVEELKNLIWTDYVNDEELKSLYASAKAFIFPSFYEGFGIPPLEAIACGCKNIFVSDTSCLSEVFEDSVSYINPKTIKKLHFIYTKNSQNILKKFEWKVSAQKIKNMLNRLTI
ncbi:glycosyltransferase, group 1 family protein [Cetobacterium somerae ATCC BAA-474]|uniref:Glycosyltransferase, group 1 family protein n=1 Tax=Cetobacterium somerae ATCC BAA-474 TaxID=1319815 RepID=U7V3J7_9FUSO|nr:glycosyltransferase family 1 protein [Cetobacterium somerae]ERT66125.1 glycosyltransferase, group 1 family protein [Cetobacterium somerae ATCC BAA-474]